METLPVHTCYRGETNELCRQRFRAKGAIMRLLAIVFSAAFVGACSPQPAENETNVQQPLAMNEPVAEPAANLAAPIANASLPEPKSPIDPKSVEAAGQVVQSYGALIEQGRWTESWKLWSHPTAAKEFDRNWRNDSEVHLEIGKPGDEEGAAGSIFVTEPVTFYGKDLGGKSFRRPAVVTLRRVNDVPGSTDEQRRWHIEQIDWNASN
jgi:hypothetical protein